MVTIRTLMTKEVISVRPDASVPEALRLLVDHEISGLPVVDEDLTIVGVLSEKDVLKMFYEEADSVASLMTPNPQTLPVDAPLVEVFDILMANDFRRLLIHEKGKLVGVISRSDLMPVLLEALLERS
jgi:CBS domain-containing protein